MRVYKDKKTKIICIVLIYGLVIQVLPIILMKRISINSYFQSIVLNLIFYIFVAVSSVILSLDLLKKDAITIFSDVKNSWEKVIIILFFTFVVFLISSICVSNMNIVNVNEKSIDNMMVHYFGATVFLSLCICPLVEELVFRYAMIRIFNCKLLGVFISAFSFGMIHCISKMIILQDYLQIVTSIPYIILGLGFALIYIESHNIYIPLLVHIALNGLSVISTLK